VAELKYSIIIPVYNGLPYLKTAVSSVLSSSRTDFELLVSDDHSTDGSLEYLRSIRDSRLRLLSTPQKLSMSEHWEWVLAQAQGAWGMFLGQDDALQGYFFEHADKLTTEAGNRSLRVIVARRSYIFWPGCEGDFPQRAQFYALASTYVRRSAVDCVGSLLLGKKYHELPQMYTNSLFHMSLIEEVRIIQGGKVFTSHPQDANLAAIALLLESRYLRTEVPLGWVGTSPSSAGLAIAKSDVGAKDHRGNVNTKLAADYSTSVFKSNIRYPEFAGEFRLASEAVYLWQALVIASERLNPDLNRKLRSKLFLTGLFASLLAENSKEWRKGFRWQAFQDLVSINGVPKLGVWLSSGFFVIHFGMKRLVKFCLQILLAKRGSSRLGGLSGFQISTKESAQIDIDSLNDEAQRLYGKLNGKI